MKQSRIDQVEDILRSALRAKFSHYKPEPAIMPFHTRLLGRDRMALFSFIHSLNTNFGTSIFEPVAIAIAQDNFARVERHAVVGSKISTQAQFVIQNIMDDLATANSAPNKPNEIDLISEVALKGELREIKPTIADLLLESKSGELTLIDLKTSKPNAGGFKEFKRTLLEWVAVSLANQPCIKVQTLIAIPYNPYAPKPYARWTIRGMLDLNNELKVAEDFWDFLGGKGTYEELLSCFERVGVELSDEIDQFFAKYQVLTSHARVMFEAPAPGDEAESEETGANDKCNDYHKLRFRAN